MAAKEIKPSILALSQKIQDSIEIDPATGVVKVISDSYVNNMPEGLTPELDKKFGDYKTDYVAASTHGFNKAAFDVMSTTEHRELNVTLPMGHKDSLAIQVRANPDAAEGDNISDVTTILTVRAGSGGAQMKLVRSAIEEMAVAAFRQ